MKSENFALVSVKYIFSLLIKHILYWPLWWYSSGFLLVLKKTGNLIFTSWKSLALDVWLKNIFRPMYGQYDIASRIISFFMRLFQIIGRLLIMVILILLFLTLPVIYLLLPVVTIWSLIKGV